MSARPDRSLRPALTSRSVLLLLLSASLSPPSLPPSLCPPSPPAVNPLISPVPSAGGHMSSVCRASGDVSCAAAPRSALNGGGAGVALTALANRVMFFVWERKVCRGAGPGQGGGQDGGGAGGSVIISGHGRGSGGRGGSSGGSRWHSQRRTWQRHGGRACGRRMTSRWVGGEGGGRGQARSRASAGPGPTLAEVQHAVSCLAESRLVLASC